MKGHARIAVSARGDPAAGIAKQGRRISPPVQEHDHLAAVLQMPLHGAHGRLRQSLIARVLAQIDEMHGGRARRAGPERQLVPRVAALRDIVERLERGRGGPEDHGNLRTLRAQHRQIPRRVAKALLLLVGRVVFLVHHDQAQALERSEDRRARSDDDARVARVRSAPGIAALGPGQPRMHGDHARAEAAPKSLDELRRQRDLGHEDQHLAVGAQRGVDDLQIHLGLAAARDAVEKMRGEAAERAAMASITPAWASVSVDLARARLDRGGRGRPRARGGGPTLVRQGPKERRLELPRSSAVAPAALAELREQRALLGRALAGADRSSSARPAAVSAHTSAGAQCRLAVAQARRKGRRHDLAERMMIVIGGPAQQARRSPRRTPAGNPILPAHA